MLKLKSQHSTPLQLILYGFIGVFTNLVGYLVFLLLTHWEVEPKIAMTCLYVISSVLSYFGNWRITFRGVGNFSNTSLRFVLIYLLGYVINFLMLWFFVDYLDYSYYLIQAIAILFVALYVFSASKLFIYSNNSGKFE